MPRRANNAWNVNNAGYHNNNNANNSYRAQPDCVKTSTV